MIEHKQ
ncbi:hypothetical protein VCHC44C1_3387A, partial [Vibrio cholerae HC-44C1]